MAQPDTMLAIATDYHRGVKRRVEAELWKVGEAIQGWMFENLAGPLAPDWRESFRAVLAEQAAQGRIVAPESAAAFEAAIEQYAAQCVRTGRYPRAPKPGVSMLSPQTRQSAPVRPASPVRQGMPQVQRLAFNKQSVESSATAAPPRLASPAGPAAPIPVTRDFATAAQTVSEIASAPLNEAQANQKHVSRGDSQTQFHARRYAKQVDAQQSRERFYNHQLAVAQGHLEDMRQRLESLGQRLETAQLDETVDVDAAVTGIEELIWRYNDAMEGARGAWLRDDLSGDANTRRLEMATPAAFGLPFFTDELQAERARKQEQEIGRRLHLANVSMNRLVVGVQVINAAVTVAGIALGVGMLATIARQGGRWAVIKTVAKAGVALGAEQLSERVAHAAGAGEQTIRGIRLAAAVVSFILLRRKVRAAPTTPRAEEVVAAETPVSTTSLVPTAPVELGKWGEVRLMLALEGRGFKPRSPLQTSLGKRYVDWMVDLIAHEAKAGLNVGLTAQIRKQALKDAELVASGRIRGAHWHFFRGAKQETLDFLASLGIQYTVH